MRSFAPEKTGAAIRKLRLARGWTLADLADQSGIPLSTLSRVELGQNPLNYDKLVRLCRALEVDIEGLVAREAATTAAPLGRRSVIRAGDGDRVRVGLNPGRAAGSDLLDKGFTPLVLSLASAADPQAAMSTLPSEAYVMVMAGQAVLHSQAYAPLRLNRGDGVYFDGRSPHALLAGDGPEAQVLLIVAGDHAFKP